jgi:UPF0271 protein
MDAAEIERHMVYQIGALQAVAANAGHRVTHVSFHAAMGNMVNRDPQLADLMMDAIAKVDDRLVIFVTPGSEIEKAAKRARLRTLALFLADRAYDAAGNLVARGLAGALVKDEVSVRARVRRFLLEGTVEAIDGSIIAMPARSILVHSDTPGSLELASLIRNEIEAVGAVLAPASELAS